MSELHWALMALSLCGTVLITRRVGRRRRIGTREARFILGAGAVMGGFAMLLVGMARL